MQRHLEAGNKILPLVFPVLFYVGETSPYPYTTYWMDCFENKVLAEYIYTQPFRLTDVTTLDDGEILQHRHPDFLLKYSIWFNELLVLGNKVDSERPCVKIPQRYPQNYQKNSTPSLSNFFGT